MTKSTTYEKEWEYKKVDYTDLLEFLTPLDSKKPEVAAAIAFLEREGIIKEWKIIAWST